MERLNALQPRFHVWSDFEKHAIDQQVGERRHQRIGLPELAELGGNDEHLVACLPAPVAERVGDERDRHTGGPGFLHKHPRQPRITAGLEDDEATVLHVGHQQLGKIAAGQIEQMNVVAQVMKLVGEYLRHTPFGLETGDINALRFGQPFGNARPLR